MKLTLEEFWAELLSRESRRTIEAWLTLTTEEERVAVWAHLQRMSVEEGWTEGQQASARAALKILRDHGITM